MNPRYFIYFHECSREQQGPWAACWIPNCTVLNSKRLIFLSKRKKTDIRKLLIDILVACTSDWHLLDFYIANDEHLCTIPFEWEDNAQRRNRGCVTACFPSPTTHWPHYGGGGRGERPSCFQSQVRGGGQVRAGGTILMKGTWSVRWEECTWRGKVPAAVSSGGKTARAALERLLLSPWAEGRSGELTPEGWWWPVDHFIQ